MNLLTLTLSVNEAGKQLGRIMLLWCHPSIYEIWPLKSFLFLKCLSISHWVYRELNYWISLVFQVGFPFKTVARSILFCVAYNCISLPFRSGFHRRPEKSGASSWPGRNLGELCVLRAVVSQWSYPGLKYALERFSGISRNVGLGVAGSWLCHLWKIYTEKCAYHEYSLVKFSQNKLYSCNKHIHIKKQNVGSTLEVGLCPLLVKLPTHYQR